MGTKKWGRETVGEGKSREMEGGERLCSSTNYSKKPRSWNLDVFDTDRRGVATRGIWVFIPPPKKKNQPK